MDLPISLELKDRTLWFDGASSVSTELLSKMILEGKNVTNIFPDELNDDVRRYNKYSRNKLDIKSGIDHIDASYTIPQEYLDINLSKYFFTRLADRLANTEMVNADVEERIARVSTELKLFKEYNIENLIKTAIYIVDVFEEHSIVWGTGRGSSCACYCLYLLGLHEVDSVKYNLELDEFFR